MWTAEVHYSFNRPNHSLKIKLGVQLHTAVDRATHFKPQVFQLDIFGVLWRTVLTHLMQLLQFSSFLPVQYSSKFNALHYISLKTADVWMRSFPVLKWVMSRSPRLYSDRKQRSLSEREVLTGVSSLNSSSRLETNHGNNWQMPSPSPKRPSMHRVETDRERKARWLMWCEWLMKRVWGECDICVSYVFPSCYSLLKPTCLSWHPRAAGSFPAPAVWNIYYCSLSEPLKHVFHHLSTDEK